MADKQSDIAPQLLIPLLFADKLVCYRTPVRNLRMRKDCEIRLPALVSAGSRMTELRKQTRNTLTIGYDMDTVLTERSTQAVVYELY